MKYRHLTLERRRRGAITLFCALAAIVLACSGDEAKPTPAADTSSPVATASPAPVATATTAPAPTATPEPPPPTATTAPAPAASPPSPPAPGGGGASSIVITASLLAFNRQAIQVPANTVVTITMQNNDAGVAHDFQVPGLGQTDSCLGPCSRSTSFNSGPPGSYSFVCSIHPALMSGSFTVR